MDERMKFVARYLDGETMAELCREFGMARKTGYKIVERYQSSGVEGLTDRSRRPVRYGNQLPMQVERALLEIKADKPNRGAPIFSQKYPNSSEAFERILKESPESMLQGPGPYTASAAINVPLWFAANKFGTDKLTEIYLLSLRDLDENTTLMTLANEVLLKTNDKAIKRYLQAQFSERGILSED